MVPASQDERIRLARRRSVRRRRLRRRVVAVVVVAVLSPILYSYVSTMSEPSSLPLSIRTVEWIRSNHGAWLVDTVEHYWYSWNAPAKGGPALTKLPTVGVTARPVSARGSTSAAKPKRVSRPPYRPPRIVPVLHPVLPLEGVWQATGQLVYGAPPVLVATYRPDPAYPRVVAYVAWIDHTRTQLALYPGRYEPPGANPRGPMEVPLDQRYRLLATFNSGFTYGDGHGGFGVDGQTSTPLRAGDGTVVAYPDGRVDVITWRGGSRMPPWLVLARQNLPLIVDGGRPNPALFEPGQFWGYTLGNAVRVWRTAVGVDRHGNLLYAAADAQTAASLAALMIHVGAVRAIELDINPEWPTFVTYSSPGGRDPIKLVPNDQQTATRYLSPDDRDFFAVYRRVPRLLRSVPFG